MNQEIKEKWLKALRSGKYKQGKYYLRNNKNEFCCLGVLCNLVDPKEWDDEPVDYFSYDNMKSFPGVRFFDSIDVDADEEKHMSEFASMNDEGKSFKEIADVIERIL